VESSFGSACENCSVVDYERIERRLLQIGEVFENSTEGILITDLNGKAIEANRAFESITGYTREEIIGNSTAILKSGRHDQAFYDKMWNAIIMDGFWQGEIYNRRKNGEVYPEFLTISQARDKSGKPISYIAMFSDLTSVKRSQEMMENLMHHDMITALPNRLLFTARLEHSVERAKRDDAKLAVLFIDIDRFKNINDTFGHAAGDEFLKSVSERFKDAVRKKDTLSRMGGDEFALLIDDMKNTDDASSVAQKLLACFEKPFVIGDKEIYASASIGIAVFPYDANDAEGLVKNADSAMFKIKESGKNGYEFYTAELTKRATERMTLENSLRKALDNEQFILKYQPKMELGESKIVGVEALIRWKHPEIGEISPLKFIPLAEETGLILPIGEWVVYESCRQAREWADMGVITGSIAINIAALQMTRSDIASIIKKAIAHHQIDPSLIEIELTESFLMSHDEKVLRSLEELRRMGVKIAIDDFGTGYSSLSYLKRLPVDTIKIDRSFVKDIPHDSDDMAIASAILAMAKSLGLGVIAEGIETYKQKDFLTANGCTYGQGFLFSKPVDPIKLLDFIDKQKKG